jgi:hypothetical protein
MIVDSYSKFASGPLAPDDVADLYKWFDASASGSLYDAYSGGSEVVDNSTAIGRWEPVFGSGDYAHITPSRWPYRTQVNGLNAIAFDGSDDYYEEGGNLMTHTGEFTMIEVFDRPTTGINSIGNTRSSVAMVPTYWDTSNSLKCRIAGTLYTAGTYTDTGVHVITLTRDASGNWEQFLNGVSVQSGNNTATGYNNRFGRDTIYPDGAYGEFVAYTSQVSTAEREGLEQYFSDKWGGTI